jgi:hypothetical protein
MLIEASQRCAAAPRVRLMDIQLPERPFTAREASALGLSRHRLAEAVRNREVRRLLTGVFLPADVEETPEIRAQAACLVISAHAVVCDELAAWIHGVDAFRYSVGDLGVPITTYVLRGHSPTNRPQVKGGSRDLVPADWTVIGGVRVTTPLRTALDLGCKLSRRRALAAMDALMRESGFTATEAKRLLLRYRRRRGVVQLRELLPLVDPRAESARESWMRLAIIDAGLPVPRPQWWVEIGGRPTYRLDLAYPFVRIAVEYNGEEFHTSEEAEESDAARLEWLTRHGWKVIVVTKENFDDGPVPSWLRELAEALRDAA